MARSCVRWLPWPKRLGALTLFMASAALFLGACIDMADRFVPAAVSTHSPADAAPLDPQVAVEPSSGHGGTYVTVNGDGWKPGDMVIVTLADAQGRSSVLAASIADSYGTFSTGFSYPAAERWLHPGAYTVLAHTESARKTATQFEVVAPADAAEAVPTALPAPESPAVAPASMTTAESNTAAALRSRLVAQGVFFAAQTTAPLTLDGNFDEWSDTWIPIDAIVWGADNYVDSADLSGDFQVRWALDGLYLAVRVRDDQYRSGPEGTDMWQGDGLEIHFDRLLEADFTDATMSDDDYQIGVSAGPALGAVRAYRWIPYDQEAVLSILGAARATDSGYAIEAQIPWSFFGVQPDDLTNGAAFGFNLSINDNDGDVPAQQTIASASPARTDHETPTQWGTLILE